MITRQGFDVGLEPAKDVGHAGDRSVVGIEQGARISSA